MFKVTLRNKTTGEVITTEEHGVVAELYINADGSYELTEVGTITESNSSFAQDTSEKYFNAEDYDLVDVQFELSEVDRKALLSKEEIIRELKPLLSDAATVYHYDEINIDKVNGFPVTELTKEEKKELYAALREMSFITHIYPRGHYNAEPQNWKVSFVEEEHESVNTMYIEYEDMDTLNTHGKTITLENGAKGTIIGNTSYSQAWGTFTIAVLEDGRIISFDAGDCVNGLIMIDHVHDKTYTSDEIIMANQIADMLDCHIDSSYFQNAISDKANGGINE